MFRLSCTTALLVLITPSLQGAEQTEPQQLSSQTDDSSPVDLSVRERSSIEGQETSDVLSRPWWRNFDLYGFGAAGFYDTGPAGTREDGGFEIKEAAIFIRADVWEDVSFFVEWQTNRLGRDSQQFTRTGEVYVDFRNIELGPRTSLGIKLGRIDIPFGEEYLWQDAIDNPLITNSAAWAYGTDEGVAVYSDFNGISWILAVTDGLIRRSTEENSDKAINLKIYGNPMDSLYLSFSAMNNGDTSISALQFGGSFLQPIGGFGHQSSVGNSPSAEIDASLVELNAKYDFQLSSYDGYLSLSLGTADLQDDAISFDRDFRWFSIEPHLRFSSQWYAVLRYSEIGTYDDSEGYHFDGKTFAGGNDAFGYDTERFKRVALGVGWTPNPHVLGKLEIGKDSFDVIAPSPQVPNNSDRGFVGLEIAVAF